jgi:hypothetical protein
MFSKSIVLARGVETKEILSSNAYYTTYFHILDADDLRVTLSDVVLSSSEIYELFGIANNSGDVPSEKSIKDIENRIKNFNSDLQKIIIKRSGIVVRDGLGHDINPEATVSLLGLNNKVLVDRNIMVLDLNFNINGESVKTNLYIPFPIKTVNYDKVQIKEITRTKVNNVYIDKAKSTSKQSVNATKTKNKTLILHKNIVKSKTVVVNVVHLFSKSSINTGEKMNLNAPHFTLSVNFIIAHGYVFTLSAGMIIILINLLVFGSSLQIFIWFRKKEKEVMNKM